MSLAQEHPCVNLATLDLLHAESLRARDLLVGALALLRGDGSTATYQLVAAARVSAASLVDTIERSVAIEHARVRSENQRIHAQAAKHVAPALATDGGAR